jgi:hypothetical protein
MEPNIFALQKTESSHFSFLKPGFCPTPPGFCPTPKTSFFQLNTNPLEIFPMKKPVLTIRMEGELKGFSKIEILRVSSSLENWQTAEKLK